MGESDTKVSFMELPNSIVFHYNHITRTVVKGTDDYTKCVQLMQTDRMHMVPSILEKETALKESLSGEDFEVKNGIMYCDGGVVDEYISKKILSFHERKLPFKPLVNFWRRLSKNPSENSVQQLYKFLEVCQCPITEDGMFIAQKGVRETSTPGVYEAIHTSSFKYTIGKYASMPRERVQDDPDAACSTGLHVGSFGYATSWGPVTLEVLIDPADVVSVPNDHSYQKLRACRVLPIAVHEGGQYSSGVAVEATPEEEKSTVKVKTTQGSAESGTAIVVNNVEYGVVALSKDEYDAIVASNDSRLLPSVSSLVRYRASKAPAAIRKVANGLLEAYKFFISGWTDPIFMYSDEEGCTLVYPVSLPVAQVLAAVTVPPVKPVKIVNVFRDTKSTVLGLVAFGGEQYEVVKLKSNQYDIPGFINTCSEGVVASVMHIKPSKVPVGLKNLLMANVTDVKRVSFADGTIAFVMHFDEDPVATLIMRKE